MTIAFPADFPSPVDLPFNRAILERDFRLSVPDRDPGGAGWWLLLQGGGMLFEMSDDEACLPFGENPLPELDVEPLYIGQWRDLPCRMMEVSRTPPLPSQLLRQPLRIAEPQVPPAMLSLGGLGQMILHWEKGSRYCGECGAPMSRLPGEWGKQCGVCKTHHFPRIHPCVIGLILRGEEVLLVRKAEWANGRYGLVAGFVEFGECLEEALAREVAEETNLQITNIRYLGSQSWPFPSQLMCGFVADYAGGDIELKDNELADAGWFRLDSLPVLPPTRSIARHLIDRAGEFIKS